MDGWTEGWGTEDGGRDSKWMLNERKERGMEDGGIPGRDCTKAGQTTTD